MSTSHLKKRILVQNRGGFKFQTDSVAVIATDGIAVTAIAGILTYVEDLELGSNKEFRPKDFFEMTCNQSLNMINVLKNVMPSIKEGQRFHEKQCSRCPSLSPLIL